ncbi:MAG TPA: glycosyltransferase N-terminal domain-containing protein, partial [Opitutales bacterium]|nr:glycosyltransferase N-terminal domain-containing protein [Opitutales bacterium]
MAVGKKRLWLHAVSVGEVQSVGQLLRRLHQVGGWEVVLTCTTSTAFQVAKQNFGAYTIAIRPFPIDFWPSSVAAWRAIRPDVVALTDTELWPEHLTQAHKRRVPVVLINGRISDRSFRRYSHFRTVSKWLMGHLRLILTATEQDYSRFITLGADPQITHRVGNIKFDVAINGMLDEQAREQLRSELGFQAISEQNRPLVVLGSSTWPGEEALLIEIVDKAREAGLDARLLLVPRHMERRDEIIPYLEQGDHPWHLRSQAVQAPHSVIIYVGDTTGELRRLSYAADLVFIGKSIPPNEGGQTPIEAAALGLPIVYGPKMNNFRDICRELEA